MSKYAEKEPAHWQEAAVLSGPHTLSRKGQDTGLLHRPHPNEPPPGTGRQRSNELTVKLKTIQDIRNKIPRQELGSYPKTRSRKRYKIWCTKQKFGAREMRGGQRIRSRWGKR